MLVLGSHCPCCGIRRSSLQDVSINFKHPLRRQIELQNLRCANYGRFNQSFVYCHFKLPLRQISGVAHRIRVATNADGIRRKFGAEKLHFPICQLLFVYFLYSVFKREIRWVSVEI